MAQARGNTKVILINYNKGGAGKTTLSIHVAGILIEEGYGQILLMDCDGRPDSMKFFTGQRPSPGDVLVEVTSTLSIFWNPPQIKGGRFKTLKKTDYSSYDFVVIDTDASPEDSLCLLSNTLPDLILIPISESQSHALEDMPPFLYSLDDEIKEKNLAGSSYSPQVRIVSLGLNHSEILGYVTLEFLEYDFDLYKKMKHIAQKDIKRCFLERNYLWNLKDDHSLKNYFSQLIETIT